MRGSLASRLILLILLGTGSILAGVGGYGYLCSRSILKEELITRVDGLGELAADRVGRIALVVETVARDMALYLTLDEIPRESLIHLMESTLEAHDEVAGLCVAFPSETDHRPAFVPFVYKDLQGVHRKDLGYLLDIPSRDWYRVPVALKRPVWTEPYFGYGGSERFVVSYGVPVYDDKGGLIAVVVCDLSLTWLADVMDSLNIPGGGEGFVVGSDGSFLSHRDRDLIKEEGPKSLAAKMGSSSLASLGERMTQGGKGITAVEEYFGQKGWIFYRPLGEIGWSMGIFFPKTAITGPLLTLLWSQLGIAIGGLALLVLVALAISRTVTGPIASLASATEVLASGDFEFPLPTVSGDDEVANLARSFASMRESLLAYVEELQDTTAARERLESELSIARSIQMSLVPRTFPPFPDRHDLDLYAILDPAKEVSGDFYDFFMLDDRRMIVAVGDVSGKGVPAALFMAVTRTFIRAFAKEGLSPGEILSRLNDEISKDNESCMFVTVFCVIVDLEDGSFVYASGGHPSPMMIRDGSVALLPPVKGPLIGPMEGVPFHQGEGTLTPGETMFIYTDGMTEATDPWDGFLGEDLPMEWLKAESLSSAEMVRTVREGIRSFAGGSPQSDDITMLALRVLFLNEKDRA